MDKRLTVAAAILSFLGMGFLGGCQKENQYVAPPPPSVTVSQPVRQKVVDFLEFTGTTEAIASVDIRARVQGFLESFHFEEGDFVDKDAVLFKIDPREYEAAVSQATAALDVAKAGLDLAEARLKRMQEAVKTNAVSVIDVLEAEAQRDQAKALVAERQATLDKHQLDLSYTVIQAPMAGRVARRLVDPGNLVGAGENTHLTTIVQYDPIYANFDVSERDLLALLNEREGDEVSQEDRITQLRQIPLELARASDEGFPYAGNMHYVDSGVDPETGTLLIRGIFPNPYPHRILPGLFVRLRTPHRERDDALLITERALGSDQTGRYVLVVDDDVVQHRSVVLGQKVGDLRVIESGLEPEDRVIVNGILRARPGAKVNPQEAETAAVPAGEGAGS